MLKLKFLFINQKIKKKNIFLFKIANKQFLVILNFIILRFNLKINLGYSRAASIEIYIAFTFDSELFSELFLFNQNRLQILA